MLEKDLGSQASAEPAAPKVSKQKIIAGVMEMPAYAMKGDDGSWSVITVDLWKVIARITDLDYEFKT